VTRWFFLVAVLSAAACRSQPAAKPAARDVVIWSEVGAWSGHGSVQTETFTSDTGGFRVRWETRNESAPGAGRLKVVFRSGDSGRPIIEAVDVRGVGHDEEEVADNVRWYFLTIESANVDWSVHVDERLRGQTTR
jgi:ABC-type glycerol-3-phosphate transport system substrate-binding protein